MAQPVETQVELELELDRYKIEVEHLKDDQKILEEEIEGLESDIVDLETIKQQQQDEIKKLKDELEMYKLL